MLTPTDVRRLLAVHGLAPRKAAGQNFVVDPNMVPRIVAPPDLAATDRVVEIGPGLGSLTLGLAGVVERVVAIEIDAGLVGALREVVGQRPEVEVVHADALRTELSALAGGGDVRIVANLPYHLATPLVVHALEDVGVSDLLVMVQREVGQRWVARPGDPLHAGVSIKLALLAEVEVALTIPRTVFHPVPNVDSVMVRLTRRSDAPAGAAWQRLKRLTDLAFAQRRKTLRNTLRELAPPQVLTEVAEAARIDLGARAETLSASDIRALDAALADAGR